MGRIVILRPTTRNPQPFEDDDENDYDCQGAGAHCTDYIRASILLILRTA